MERETRSGRRRLGAQISKAVSFFALNLTSRKLRTTSVAGHSFGGMALDEHGTGLYVADHTTHTIEPDELTACLLVEGTGCTYAQIKEIFDELDRDSDGTIERREFERVQGMFPDLIELAMMRVEMHKAERAKWPLLYRLRGAQGKGAAAAAVARRC